MDPFYQFSFALALFVLVCGIIKELISRNSNKIRYKAPELSEQNPQIISAKAVRTLEETIDRLRDLSLPSAHGNLMDIPASEPEQSHIGGPVYLPEGVPYPCNEAGERLIFIIQINFADVPKLPGYPESGVLQLFGHNDPYLGLVPSKPGDKTKRTLLYWPDPKCLTQKHEAEVVEKFQHWTIFALDYLDKHNPNSKALDMHKHGRMICFQPELKKSIPDLKDFPADHLIEHNYGNYDRDDWNPIMNDITRAVESLNVKSPIKIGGYPIFCQGDNRPYTRDSSGRYITRFTRVLLNLNSLEGLMIWDAGTINLLITPEDLANTNFNKVEFDISG